MLTGIKDSFWIAGRRAVAGGLKDFVWVGYHNQPVTYTDWWQQDPNNYAGKEDCAMLWEPKNFKWADAKCSQPLSFVCEKGRN